MAAAKIAGWDNLKSVSIQDFQQYFNRTSIDFGNSPAVNGTKNTGSRIYDWQHGTNVTGDPELLALGFNMGKYLLIQSSRPGTLPANLQGIWNKDFLPPWDSKWTININLEMNYWLAQPNNLPEISEPVFYALNRMRQTGTKMAKAMYNATGLCCHHNTDINFDCAPYHSSTIDGPFPLGGAWLSFEAIERFRFTQDTDFAKNTALPILTDVVEFIKTFTILRNGYYISSPICSPENSYYITAPDTVDGNTTGLDQGPMVDRSITHEVLAGFIEISNAVNSTTGVAEAQHYLDRIEGPVVGDGGRMLEYSKEIKENDQGHRHFSPLVCVHPGTWVSPLKNTTAADAAYALLQWRIQHGSGSTGWSDAWASILYARFFQAADALHWAANMITRWMYTNMLGRNGGYFQIDGNLGLVSALTEMMLQSHNGVVHLGPALPSTPGIETGSMKGFVARGGFLVDMAWEDGKVTSATITSMKGGNLKVRVQDNRPFKINGNNGTSTATTAGEKYTISF